MSIDRALRARAWPNSRTLANQIGVDRRTIRRDIDYLRDQLHAPIEFDSVRNGYHYTEPSFRLPFPQLNQGEMLALYLSERVMRQFRGTPFERDLRHAIKIAVQRVRSVKETGETFDRPADFRAADYMKGELSCHARRRRLRRRLAVRIARDSCCR